MKRTKLLQEIGGMQFEEVYCRWTESGFSQEEAARLVGVQSSSSNMLVRYFY